MRSIILSAVAAAALLPGTVMAQSASELHKNNRELQQDRKEVRRDLRRGDIQEAREDMQELREDRREAQDDWRRYRDSNRDVFRRGAYRGPRGYHYRTVTVGSRFAPTYYSSRYWVANPTTYRLPRPGVHQRWVRYGNDVVLINVRTGRVVKVYSSFFL